MIGAQLEPGICLRLSTLCAFYVQSMQTLWCSFSVTPFLGCSHPSPSTCFSTQHSCSNQYECSVEKQRPTRLSSYSLGRYIRGAGILTCCPSATLLSLTLGPTNPTPIDVAWETLGIRRTGFSPVLWLLMPTVSLLFAPLDLTVGLHCRIERSSTAHRTRMFYALAASVNSLIP